MSDATASEHTDCLQHSLPAVAVQMYVPTVFSTVKQKATFSGTSWTVGANTTAESSLANQRSK